uniref:SFRICE_011293 n=1 Tax=Spodoptera frugiperda TaxID=7108 RepID=A0A2H1VZE7_SPOFR
MSITFLDNLQHYSSFVVKARFSDLHNHLIIRRSSAIANSSAFLDFFINSVGFRMNYILNGLRPNITLPSIRGE